MRDDEVPAGAHNSLGNAVVTYRQVENEYSPVALRQQLRRVRQLVDDRTGIVRRVVEHCREPDDPLLYNASVILANTGEFFSSEGGDEDFPLLNAPQGNGGAGISRERCLLGAIGEGLERYAFSVVDRSDQVVGSHRDLVSPQQNPVHPSRFALFSEAQYAEAAFPFEPFDEATVVGWSECDDLTSGSTCLYPSALIFMPYSHGVKEEAIISPTISTGQAVAPSLEKATLTGLMETVERDAFTISWLRMLPAPRLDVFSSPMVSEFMQRVMDPCPVDVILNYISLDVPIPVVVATGVDPMNPEISCTVGVAAHLDPEVAALKALIELCQDRYYVKHLSRVREPIPFDVDFSLIDDFEKRVILFNQPEAIASLAFWRESGDVMEFGALESLATGRIEDDLARAVQMVADRGGTVVRRDCTPGDLAAVGLAASKVLIPEFQALEGDHNLRYLGCARLGQSSSRSEPAAGTTVCNPVPHPLP